MSNFHGGDKRQEKASLYPNGIGGLTRCTWGQAVGVNALEQGAAKESDVLLLCWQLLLES